MVTLRALEPEDLDELYAIENDRTTWGVGVTNVPYSRFILCDFIARATGDIYADRQVRLMVCDEGRTIGIVDLVNFDPAHCRAEVSIIIKTAYRRHGYAAETLRQIAAYAHDTLHLHTLYAIVPTSNTPSAALFRKGGYTPSGTLREWLYDGTGYHDATIFQLTL